MAVIKTLLTWTSMVTAGAAAVKSYDNEWVKLQDGAFSGREGLMAVSVGDTIFDVVLVSATVLHLHDEKPRVKLPRPPPPPALRRPASPRRFNETNALQPNRGCTQVAATPLASASRVTLGK